MDTFPTDELWKVLWGKTRGGILGLLLGRPDEEFHVRRIARLSGTSVGPVQRELKVLARLGVLKRREVGRQIFYSADPASPIHEELRGLVLKTVGVAGVVGEAIKSLGGQVRVAFLFGSFAQGREKAASDVDVMVIGEARFAAVAKVLTEAQRRLGREVNPAVYSPMEFAGKLRRGHHFLNAVLAGPKVFLVGDADELSRLAEERLASAAPDEPGGGRGAVGGDRAGPDGQR